MHLAELGNCIHGYFKKRSRCCGSAAALGWFHSLRRVSTARLGPVCWPHRGPGLGQESELHEVGEQGHPKGLWCSSMLHLITHEERCHHQDGERGTFGHRVYISQPSLIFTRNPAGTTSFIPPLLQAQEVCKFSALIKSCFSPRVSNHFHSSSQHRPHTDKSHSQELLFCINKRRIQFALQVKHLQSQSNPQCRASPSCQPDAGT